MTVHADRTELEQKALRPGKDAVGAENNQFSCLDILKASTMNAPEASKQVELAQQFGFPILEIAYPSGHGGSRKT
jgi:hypothetical protein